jgi:hypothetical protein
MFYLWAIPTWLHIALAEDFASSESSSGVGGPKMRAARG